MCFMQICLVTAAGFLLFSVLMETNRRKLREEFEAASDLNQSVGFDQDHHLADERDDHFDADSFETPRHRRATPRPPASSGRRSVQRSGSATPRTSRNGWFLLITLIVFNSWVFLDYFDFFKRWFSSIMLIFPLGSRVCLLYVRCTFRMCLGVLYQDFTRNCTQKCMRRHLRPSPSLSWV